MIGFERAVRRGVDRGLREGIARGLELGLENELRKLALKTENYGLAMLIDERGARHALAMLLYLAEGVTPCTDCGEAQVRSEVRAPRLKLKETR